MDQYRIRVESRLPQPGEKPAPWRACISDLKQAVIKAQTLAEKKMRSKKQDQMFAVFVDWTKDQGWVQPGIYGIAAGKIHSGKEGSFTEFVSVNPVTSSDPNMLPVLFGQLKQKYLAALHHTPEHTLYVSAPTVTEMLSRQLFSIVPSEQSQGNKPWAVVIYKAEPEGVRPVCRMSGRGYGKNLQIEASETAVQCTESEKEEIRRILALLPKIEQETI